MKILSRHASDFLADTEVWHVLPCDSAQILRVCISGPDHGSLSTPVGTVYATDPPWLAGTLVNTIRSCNLSGELPPLYAVSVGYPLDCRGGHLTLRTRELTPTARPDFDSVYPWMAGQSGSTASGGGPKFLAFLKDDLRPALESEFPINSADTTLVGASLGGLFCLYALLYDSQSFRRYLAISPSIWWDDRLVLGRARQLVASTAPPTADLYMCAGELESRDDLVTQFADLEDGLRGRLPQCLAEANVPADMNELAHILNPWKGPCFRIAAHQYPQESHNSIGGAALSRGLRTLFGSLPWS